MLAIRALTLLLLTLPFISSTPLSRKPVPPSPGLRLIKTSENDPGVWATEDEKVSKYVSNRIGFVDITDTWDLEELSGVAQLSRRAITYPSSAQQTSTALPLVANVKRANLESNAKAMTDIYNRYYKGSYAGTSATWMFNAVKSAASSNSAITVSQFTHSSYSQPSVIATIPGTSSAQTVIIGAHYDSIGSTTSGRAPGADDNASGVVVILEALRVLAEAKFKPSKANLEFHFYSGEEGGLLGSRDIMRNYVSRKVNVVAMMNQDMAGYSPNKNIAVYSDYVDASLSAFIRKIVPVYTSLPVITDSCGYGCSDHASAYSAGFPAAYVCDENYDDSSPYIHSAQDTYATLQFDHVMEHAKFTVGFAVESASF